MNTVVLPRAKKNLLAQSGPDAAQMCASSPTIIPSLHDATPSCLRPVDLPEVSAFEIRRQEETLLMAAVAERDPVAFEKIYHRFYRPLYACVLKIVRCHAEAEDVLQGAFVAVWSHANGYRPELGQPFAWVSAIARHQAFNSLRKRARELEKSVRALHLREDAAETTAARAGLETTDRDRVLQAAFARLTRGEIRALWLSFFNGLTHTEISSVLNLPAGTVKARIRRALLKLRPLVSALSDAPPRSRLFHSTTLPTLVPLPL